jgi:hypothetical protein
MRRPAKLPRTAAIATSYCTSTSTGPWKGLEKSCTKQRFTTTLIQIDIKYQDGRKCSEWTGGESWSWPFSSSAQANASLLGQCRREVDYHKSGELYKYKLYHGIESKHTSNSDSMRAPKAGTLLGTIKIEKQGSWVLIPMKRLAEIEDRRKARKRSIRL